MLVCTSCQTPLPAVDAGLGPTPVADIVCPSCDARFQYLNRVPVIARDARVTERRRPTAAFVGDLAGIIAPDLPAATHDELGDIFAHSVLFGSLDLQVEADQFTQRVIHSGYPLAPMYEDDGSSVATAPRPAEANADIRLALALTITPGRVAAGHAFAVQVHITNKGDSRLTSAGGTPLMLSSLCVPSDQPDAPPLEGSRTPLLIDLDPGMRITMPVALQAPGQAGRYCFRVAALQEYVRWFLDEAPTFETEVVEVGDPCAVDWPRGTVLRDYGGDHLSAIELLRSWLARYAPPDPVLLELGGNANPMVAGLPGTKYNVDIDAFGLAFGEVRQRVSGQSGVTYVAADGTDLPFADGVFDCICLFATFHHFPQPIVLLKHLRRKLKPSGLLCLLCEPIGHVFHGPGAAEFLGELRRGVNEQSFELWEYRDMLAAADYEIVDVLVDVGSIKLAARPARR